MKSLLTIAVIIAFAFQFNAEMNAQKIKESTTRYTVTALVNNSLTETIDKLIVSVPEYHKDSALVYVVNGIKTNRMEILPIQAAKVKSVSLVKKDIIQGLYGIDALSGVVEITTSMDNKVRRVVTGHKIPDDQMKLLFGTGKENKDSNAVAPANSESKK